MFWNAFQPPPGLGEAFVEVYHRPMPGPDAYTELCDKAAGGLRQTGGFGDPEQWRFDWDRDYTRDEWLDQVPTFGFNTRLPRATMDDVLAGMGAAIDAVGGSFTMHYGTVALCATRTGRRAG